MASKMPQQFGIFKNVLQRCYAVEIMRWAVLYQARFARPLPASRVTQEAHAAQACSEVLAKSGSPQPAQLRRVWAMHVWMLTQGRPVPSRAAASCLPASWAAQAAGTAPARRG